MNYKTLAKYGSLILLRIVFIVAVSPTAALALDQPRNEETSCRVVEAAARANQLPVTVLTRLIWFESQFQVGAESRAGAQGIAQFMPETASERGLSDPFDPDLAIPQAASFLAELERRFGNIGLAIAAYNAGPGRVANWLDRSVSLPRETWRFVIAVTGRSPEEWQAFGPYQQRLPLAAEPQSCIQLRAFLRSAGLYDLDPDRGRLMPRMEQSGRLLPGMNQSGRLLPGLQQSGRLLLGLGQSGRPVER